MSLSCWLCMPGHTHFGLGAKLLPYDRKEGLDLKVRRWWAYVVMATIVVILCFPLVHQVLSPPSAGSDPFFPVTWTLLARLDTHDGRQFSLLVCLWACSLCFLLIIFCYALWLSLSPKLVNTSPFFSLCNTHTYIYMHCDLYIYSHTHLLENLIILKQGITNYTCHFYLVLLCLWYI